MIKEFLRRNHENFLLDYETSLITDCVSPFAYAFDKFKGQKSLDEFVQKQKFYVAPKQINIRFDEVSQKEDSIQYVPLLSTLDVILQHEDVLSEILADTNCNNNNLGNKLKSFKDGTAYKENKLFSSDKNTLQICLYHDDFNIVNPLGNKTQKYKISAFYFVIGNLSAKFKSRLKDVHLAILSPAYLVGKYGYKKILAPLLEDLQHLETTGINVSFQGREYLFFGSLSMVIADYLAAHALGGFFVTFQLFKDSVGFVIAVNAS